MIQLEVTRGLAVGKKLESSADVVRIGRAIDNDFVLPEDLVSSEHARILFTGERYVLFDQRSTNGTAILRETERIVLDDTNGREGAREAVDAIELGSGDRVVVVAVSLAEEADFARVVAVRKIEEFGP